MNSGRSGPKLLALMRRLVLNLIKDKCSIFSSENSRKLAFEIIFEKVAGDAFDNLSLKERIELIPYLR